MIIVVPLGDANCRFFMSCVKEKIFPYPKLEARTSSIVQIDLSSEVMDVLRPFSTLVLNLKLFFFLEVPPRPFLKYDFSNHF